jgi:hypothetical protein
VNIHFWLFWALGLFHPVQVRFVWVPAEVACVLSRVSSVELTRRKARYRHPVAFHRVGWLASLASRCRRLVWSAWPPLETGMVVAVPLDVTVVLTTHRCVSVVRVALGSCSPRLPRSR